MLFVVKFPPEIWAFSYDIRGIFIYTYSKGVAFSSSPAPLLYSMKSRIHMYS